MRWLSAQAVPSLGVGPCEGFATMGNLKRAVYKHANEPKTCKFCSIELLVSNMSLKQAVRTLSVRSYAPDGNRGVGAGLDNQNHCGLRLDFRTCVPCVMLILAHDNSVQTTRP